MYSYFNCASNTIKTYSFQCAESVSQQFKEVTHQTGRDVTHDVTGKNAQSCQTGTRRLLSFDTLVLHQSK